MINNIWTSIKWERKNGKREKKLKNKQKEKNKKEKQNR